MSEMTRYAPDRSGLNMEPRHDGIYVLHTDALDAVSAASVPGRSDEEIVRQTNELARTFAQNDGYRLEGEVFYSSENPRVKSYWRAACVAQEMLTNTDPNDALSALELDDEPLSVHVSDRSEEGRGERNNMAVEAAVKPLLERIAQLEVEVIKSRLVVQKVRMETLEEAAGACATDAMLATTEQFALGVEWCSHAVRELKSHAPVVMFGK